MAENRENIQPRFFLMRLISGAFTSFHSQKLEGLVRSRQKEGVVHRLLGQFPDDLSAVICNDESQAKTICENVYTSIADAKVIESFYSGKIKQLAIAGPVLLHPKLPTNVLIAANGMTENKLADYISQLLENENITIFLLFHSQSVEEWIVSTLVDNFDPAIMALQDVTVPAGCEPDKQNNETDFDRTKSYILPYKRADAEYKFMWNDGYPDIYCTIIANGRVLEEGTRFNSHLLNLLNMEFTKTKPSESLTKLVSDIFNEDDSDYEVIFSNED